ncbi:LacI family DNA-binding transcriptional regulator [Actinomadura madurae]|uniref:LacI family DNA-binding transcriptional regulator n=1 Tax=Actinomadura madurae TaxID=1993 RepID=UPI0020D1FAE3|nr:LacI family DNA-binding transcriptional regulator [Actinomadura madurae]MCQ0011871.1 LacI family transcriptional regulator [Actinomadura madurae]
MSPETRERVRAEAERLGYVPNTMARSLVQGNAMTIGLVITNPSNPFYARLISAIEERGRVHGYALMLMVTEDSVENERRVVDELMRWGVDGVLAVPVQHGSDHWERLRKSGTPVVLLNRDLPELDTDLVGVDYYDSARRATEHLVAGGARDLYLVEEDLDISPVAERVRGFRTVLDEHGVTVRDDHMVKVPTRRREASSQPWDPVDSYEIGRELAARIEPGAAVLAGNDYFALGVYRAFTEHGLRIPGDVRIAGHGDHAFAAYLAPPLSTVRLPAADVGATAVDRLLERMSGEAAAGSPRQTLLPAELVVRASSRAGGG